MNECKVTVGSSVGLHARPASLFVQEAAKQPVPVLIRKDPSEEPAVDARSILSVLALDARGGETVVLSADGEGSEAALEALAAIVATDWDNEDSKQVQ